MGEPHEAEFRALIRTMVEEGQYPDHRSVRNAIGSRNEGSQLRSGLSQEETKWRRDEVERAGYDWSASKLKKALVRA